MMVEMLIVSMVMMKERSCCTEMAVGLREADKRHHIHLEALISSLAASLAERYPRLFSPLPAVSARRPKQKFAPRGAAALVFDSKPFPSKTKRFIKDGPKFGVQGSGMLG